ncbi:DUF6328 family protein [Streptomyces sp. NPDC005438]|uniref:DUF6328 family protein n=1 Tax=Streptomyces sp. NPDC005438 TaxID=3156880 RepID=UPI0033B5CBFB
MSDGRTGAHSAARNETPRQRDDRNFVELLQELRVVQTGVQILFAFLLTIVFTERFPELHAYEKGVYVTTFLLAVLTAVLFTAPAALHRWLFRRDAKRLVVEVSSRLAAVGLGALSLTLAGAVLLVTSLVLGRAWGAVVCGLTVVACAVTWAGVPWALRYLTERRRTPAPPGSEDPGR